MSRWVAVLAASVIAFTFKLAGYTVPPTWLQKPRITRVTEMLPAALLAALGEAGVETVEELKAVADQGVHLAQGYVLALERMATILKNRAAK